MAARQQRSRFAGLTFTAIQGTNVITRTNSKEFSSKLRFRHQTPQFSGPFLSFLCVLKQAH